MKHPPSSCNHGVSFFVAARSKYHAPAMPVYMKELGKPQLFFHDLLWAYRSAIPWSAHGSYTKRCHNLSFCSPIPVAKACTSGTGVSVM